MKNLVYLIVISMFFRSTHACLGKKEYFVMVDPTMSDVMAVDPLSRKIFNLTKGRIVGGRPWEAIGNDNGSIVFRTGGIVQVMNYNSETKDWDFTVVEEKFSFPFFFAWNPTDGESFAFINGYAEEGSYIVVMDNKYEVKNKIPIPSYKGDWLKWSNDGKWLGIPTKKGIFISSPDGEKNFTLPNQGAGFAFRPNSKSAAVVMNRMVTIVDLDGKILKTYKNTNTTEIMDWSPHGLYISYTNERNVVYILSTTFGTSFKVDKGTHYGKFSYHGSMMAVISYTDDYDCEWGFVRPPFGWKFHNLIPCNGDCGTSWVEIQGRL